MVRSDAIVVTGDILMVDEKLLVEPPDLPDGAMDLVHFNALFALLVHGRVNSTFPAIKSTDNKRTTAIPPKTVGYIHALVIDTVTFHSSEPPYARVLTNARIVCGEVDKLTPAAFRTELGDGLADYYVKICGMEGAGGTPQAKTHKRKFKAIAPAPAAEHDMDEDAGQEIAVIESAAGASAGLAAGADAAAGAGADAAAGAGDDGPALAPMGASTQACKGN